MPIYRQAESRLGRRHIAEWRRRAVRAMVLVVLIVAGCTAGLMLLDSQDAPLASRWIHALWNSINLITTLGDFTSFDEHQRVFMIGVMFVAIVVGGYALTQLTGLLSNDAVLALRENNVVKRKLDRLADHVIVLGFGPLGLLVAQRLRNEGRSVVIVERSDVLAAQAAEQDYIVVQADAGADDDALKQAGLERAQALVVTAEDPDRKLAITLMAHSINPRVMIAVTGANQQRGALLHRAGASEVIIAEDLIAGALVERLGNIGPKQ